MVATVRPTPGQSDEDFFELVYLGQARGGHYKPEEYAAWLKRRNAEIANTVRDERIAELERELEAARDKIDGLDSDYSAAKARADKLEARVEELLKANTAEVERRRDAEARIVVLENEIAQRRKIAQEAVKAIEELNRDYAAECAKDAENPPTEVHVGRHRFVPEADLEAEKMANAQLFECLRNIKRAAVDRPAAAALGTLSYIYEVANAAAPDAPAKDTPISSDWLNMPAPSDTDPELLNQKEIDELLGFDAPTCSKCGADRQLIHSCTDPNCPPVPEGGAA